MPTQRATVRIPDGLEQAARRRRKALADEPLALVIRVGLAYLAGWPIDDALRILRGSHAHKIRMPDDENMQAGPGNRV